jgi:hypothetical protein
MSIKRQYYRKKGYDKGNTRKGIKKENKVKKRGYELNYGNNKSNISE